MKSILLVALSFAVTPALAASIVLKNTAGPANPSMKLKFSLTASTTASFEQSAPNLFTNTGSKSTAMGSMTISAGTETQSQVIPAQNSTGEAKGFLRILSNNEVQYQSEGQPLKMKAKITRNASGAAVLVEISDKEFAKAAKQLMQSQGAAQMAELQNNPAVSKAILNISGMTCSGNGSKLNCSQSMTATFEAAQ